MWTPAAEIWSLGAVIWKIAMGRPPKLCESHRGTKTFLEYECNTITIEGCSKPLTDVLDTMLDAKPSMRSTSLEMVQKVNRAQDILAQIRVRQRILRAGERETGSSQGTMPKAFGDYNFLLHGSDETRKGRGKGKGRSQNLGTDRLEPPF